MQNFKKEIKQKWIDLKMNQKDEILISRMRNSTSELIKKCIKEFNMSETLNKHLNGDFAHNTLNQFVNCIKNE